MFPAGKGGYKLKETVIQRRGPGAGAEGIWLPSKCTADSATKTLKWVISSTAHMLAELPSYSEVPGDGP